MSLQAMRDAPQKSRILIADDSAVIRAALRRLLQSEPDLEVVAAIQNGQLAISKAAECKPDIVILDIEMPVMDGLAALPKILAASPESKVIMFSSLTEKGASVTMQALSLGAVECIVKPSSNESVDPGSPFQQRIVNLIRNLTKKKDKARTASAPSDTSFTLRKAADVYVGKPRIIGIGSSTGGPQALFEVLKNLKGIHIPIMITQHMPATFTTMLAQHIIEHTGITTLEAEDGMRVDPGKIYVARGGQHMIVDKDTQGAFIKLDDGPPEHFCKPSVEPMFRSLLEHFGNRLTGVILTGMGDDGVDAAKKLAEQNCPLIAQDEATSVVWGMPGAVARAGLCSEILPLQEIGPHIRKSVLG